MIRLTSSGSYSKTLKFLGMFGNGSVFGDLDRYGKMGVKALESATPRESGQTAKSWDYKISKENGRYSIAWTNSHIEDGVNIAVILQYGHGTGTGGYVEGIDYINPALRPVFEKMADEIWKKVTNA